MSVGRDRERRAAASVLLIDDDARLLELMAGAFAAAGYAVRSADGGEAGLRLFREETPHLVVTDIVMPEREGIELIIEMKRTAPDVRVIAITGWLADQVDLLDMARHLGADAGLRKPFGPRDLVAAADRLLEA